MNILLGVRELSLTSFAIADDPLFVDTPRWGLPASTAKCLLVDLVSFFTLGSLYFQNVKKEGSKQARTEERQKKRKRKVR